jgi:hypothetical protein
MNIYIGFIVKVPWGAIDKEPRLRLAESKHNIK